MLNDTDAPEFIPDGAPEFIADAPPEFIPDDPSYASEILTGVPQGLMSAGASSVKLAGPLVAGIGNMFTDEDLSKRLPTFKKDVDAAFGIDKQVPMQTIPGKTAQSLANIVPFLINKPMAVVGVGTMYNDIVDDLVSKGIDKNRARKIAIEENAAMLLLTAGVGKGMASTILAGFKPISGIVQRAINAASGGTGFVTGMEASHAIGNAELSDRPDLQKERTNTDRASEFLTGGVLGAFHPVKKENVKPIPEVEKDIVHPEFIPDEVGGVSKMEKKFLEDHRLVLDDKAEKINLEIEDMMQQMEETGIHPKEQVELLDYLEKSFAKVVEDKIDLEEKTSGNYTKDATTERQVARDVRKQQLINEIKSRRGGSEKPFQTDMREEIPDIGEKLSPVDVAIDNIKKATSEPEHKVALRLQEVEEKLANLANEQIADEVPEKDYNSLRKNLQEEIKNYENIIRGETIDLSWYESTRPKPPSNKGPLAEHKTTELGDVIATESAKEPGKYQVTFFDGPADKGAIPTQDHVYNTREEAVRAFEAAGKEVTNTTNHIPRLNKIVYMPEEIATRDAEASTGLREQYEREHPLADVKEQDITTTADVIKNTPIERSRKGLISRNYFGQNALAKLYSKHPIVQQVFHSIRKADMEAQQIQNQLWFDTNKLIEGAKISVMDTFSKVKDKTSAFIAVTTTSNKDMKIIHDLHERGFFAELDYETNLKENGQHLTPDQTRVYNTLSKLYTNMYDAVVAKQDFLGKKYIMAKRPGWYPATRAGRYSVNILFNGNIAYIEYFKTKQAADIKRRQITNGQNLKFLDVSDVIDTVKDIDQTMNADMAEIIGGALAKIYPTAGKNIQKSIDTLVSNMQARGGKLGYHHQHRANIPGYKGSELFRSPEELGSSYKEGIQASVNNFGMNLKALMIKTYVDPLLTDRVTQTRDVEGHAIASQIYDSSMGRNRDLLNHWEDVPVRAIDKTISRITSKLLGREFEAREGSAAEQTSNVAMRVFYNTKMMAKPVFSIIGQVLSTPMVSAEMAVVNPWHIPYSFAKGMTKYLTGNKELWDHLKETSQKTNLFEEQMLESMNLSRHTGTNSRTMKIIEGVEDWVLLQKPGKGMDSLSRVLAYTISYEHFKDAGLSKENASYQAGLAMERALNTYDKSHSAPMFDKLGVVGHGLKPLSSYGHNQTGMVISYLRDAIDGKKAPLVAFGMTSIAMGGIISLPFIQDYEVIRKVLMKYTDTIMPSILEIFSGDDSFMDRLQIHDQDAKDATTYGLTALTGIDLASSVRANEQFITLLGTIVMAEESATKLIPMLGATVGTVGAIPSMVQAAAGNRTVGETNQAVNALITGPINYGMKEALGSNTTKVMGSNTNIKASGKKGVADEERTMSDIVAGVFGTKTVKQRQDDQVLFELQQKDRILQAKKDRAVQMFTETGDQKYLDKMVELGMDDKQISSGVDQAAYTKFVDQGITYYRSNKGSIKADKANKLFNFGIKR
jgi:hypothetical protein